MYPALSSLAVGTIVSFFYQVQIVIVAGACVFILRIYL